MQNVYKIKLHKKIIKRHLSIKKDLFKINLQTRLNNSNPKN